MNITRVARVSTLAVGIGLAGLTSGAAIAGAEPGPPCPQFGNCQGPGGPPGGPPGDHGGTPGGPSGDHGGPPGGDHGPGGGPQWGGPGDHDRGPDNGGPPWGPPGGPPPPPPPDLGWRGIDQGRFDHQPFNYNGSWVTPVYNPDFNNWGFWFFGVWIPL